MDCCNHRELGAHQGTVRLCRRCIGCHGWAKLHWKVESNHQRNIEEISFVELVYGVLGNGVGR
ncbi:unnamed protein product, partial [Vitis vinifera]